MTELIHKRLELIRRLESKSFIFDTDPKTATDIAKTTQGTPFEKLCYRADLIDHDDTLMTALQKNLNFIGLFKKGYYGLYFLLGFVGTFGILSTHIVNFFYVLIALLGWHTLALMLWLFALRGEKSHLNAYALFDKIKPKDPVLATAFEIELDHFKKNDTWHLGKITHTAWIFGLLGTLFGLLVLFTFKSFNFMWESTLLTQAHFAHIFHALAFIPKLLGITTPTELTLASSGYLARLILLNVVLFALLPRALAWFYCHVKTKEPFGIDTQLYYYENLHRKLNQTVVNPDDFTPEPVRPSLAKPTSSLKVVATLEYEASEFWYQFGAGNHIKDLGKLDAKSDLEYAVSICRTLNAELYLGISGDSLPDRGVLRKLDFLQQHAPFGMVVEFFEQGEHLDAWREVLVERGLSEVRY